MIHQIHLYLRTYLISIYLYNITKNKLNHKTETNFQYNQMEDKFKTLQKIPKIINVMLKKNILILKF